MAESLRVGYQTPAGFFSAKPVSLKAPRARSRAALGGSMDTTRSPSRQHAAREMRKSSELKRISGSYRKFAMEPLFSAGEYGGPKFRKGDY